MGTPYSTLVGQPPVITSIGWRGWYDALINARLAECPVERTTAYYFGQAGNDTTGDGSISNPWRSITKMNAVIAASSGDLRIRLRCGDEWNDADGSGVPITLNIGKPHVSVDPYVDPNAQSERKPILSAFSNKTTATSSWTAETVGYSTPASTTVGVGWIRRKLDISNDGVLIKVSSLSDLQAWFVYGPGAKCGRSYGCWFHDKSAGKLYINVPGWWRQPTQAGGALFEWTNDNHASSGLYIDNVDDVRIQDIRMDGYGLSSSSNPTQNWGMMGAAAGTNAFVVTGCEFYYTGRHSMGLGCPTSGGIATFSQCRSGLIMGWSPEDVGVGYASQGGHEVLFHECAAVAGFLPVMDAGLSHTGCTRSGAVITIGSGTWSRTPGQNEQVWLSDGTVSGFYTVASSTTTTLTTTTAFTGATSGISVLGNNKLLTNVSGTWTRYTTTARPCSTFRAHCSSGSYTAALFVAYGCRSLPGPWCCGTWGGVQNTPDWYAGNDLGLARSYIVECDYRIGGPTPFDCVQAVDMGSAPAGNAASHPTVVANSYMEFANFYCVSLTAAMCSPATSVPLSINTIYNVDLSHFGGTLMGNFGWLSHGTNSPVFLFNCHVHVSVSPTYSSSGVCGAFDHDSGSSDLASLGLSDAAWLCDSIVSVDNAGVQSYAAFHNNIAQSGASIRPKQQLNNAYYGVAKGTTSNASPRYYWCDDNAVTMTQPALPGTRPTAASPLLSSVPQPVFGFRLEYDREWQGRDSYRPAIGPLEPWRPSQGSWWRPTL